MIQVPNKTLPSAVSSVLKGYQKLVDSKPDYPSRVEAAKAQFKACNVAANSAFQVVRRTLNEMCHGSKRCMYCEDAPADEVEHFKPKDLYPEATFRWDNYLYACGPCNGPKNNKFSIILKESITDVTRRRNDSVVAPPRGRPAMINPRKEDPLDFFMLDISNTFEFVIIATPGSLDYERADYTLKVLRLNDRDYLITSRRTAFGAYRSLLKDLGDQERAGDRDATERIKNYIIESNHITVWNEMRRQQASINELRQLFDRAPWALDWS